MHENPFRNQLFWGCMAKFGYELIEKRSAISNISKKRCQFCATKNKKNNEFQRDSPKRFPHAMKGNLNCKMKTDHLLSLDFVSNQVYNYEYIRRVMCCQKHNSMFNMFQYVLSLNGLLLTWFIENVFSCQWKNWFRRIIKWLNCHSLGRDHCKTCVMIDKVSVLSFSSL